MSTISELIDLLIIFILLFSPISIAIITYIIAIVKKNEKFFWGGLIFQPVLVLGSFIQDRLAYGNMQNETKIQLVFFIIITIITFILLPSQQPNDENKAKEKVIQIAEIEAIKSKIIRILDFKENTSVEILMIDCLTNMEDIRLNSKEQYSGLFLTNISFIDTILFTAFLMRAHCMMLVGNKKYITKFNSVFADGSIKYIKTISTEFPGKAEEIVHDRFNVYDGIMMDNTIGSVNEKYSELVQRFTFIILNDASGDFLPAREIHFYLHDISDALNIKNQVISYYKSIPQKLNSSIENVINELKRSVHQNALKNNINHQPNSTVKPTAPEESKMYISKQAFDKYVSTTSKKLTIYRILTAIFCLIIVTFYGLYFRCTTVLNR